MMNHNALCHQYLNLVYHDNKKTSVADKKNIALTYGEILPQGVDRLLAAINLTDDDVFLDLGSGTGKVVAQVFLQTTIAAAYGIELLPGLHQEALLTAEKIREDLPNFFLPLRKLDFFCGDFLQFPLPMASIALISSPCFGPSLLHPLAKIIDASSAIRYLFSVRPMDMMHRLRFKKVLRIEGSWDSTLCYLYGK